jgi:predicted acetyltransferase
MFKSEVALERATVADRTLLENLLELYAHDLSDAFQIDIDANGRFGYEKLPLYWSEPDHRFAFLIHCENRVAGFVFIVRDENGWDVAEFFVLRRYRRSGVGRKAAFLVWDRYRGAWTVRVAETNKSAIQFWSVVIDEATNGAATESKRSGWHVFTFVT